MIIRTEPTDVKGPMGRAEARAITDRIRNAVESIYQLVAEAQDRRAWKALGYKTWEEYARAEFGMGRAHSYRVGNHGRLLAAIAEAAGDLSPMGDISERVGREIKDDLPTVTEEIKQRVEAGEDPQKAVDETVAAARDANATAKAEKQAKQAEHDRQRDEARAALPDAIKQHEAAKATAVAARKAESGLSLQDRIDELEENVRVLEKENADLKAENKLYGEMKAQFEKGGFEKVIDDLRTEIGVQETRVYGESRDKISYMNEAKRWKKRAEELGYERHAVIDIGGADA